MLFEWNLFLLTTLYISVVVGRIAAVWLWWVKRGVKLIILCLESAWIMKLFFYDTAFCTQRR